MKINIVPIPVPMFNEFTVFEKLDLNQAIEDGFLIVTASQHTKTRVHTNVKVRKAQYGVNWKFDGFNTYTEEKHSFWTYEKETAHYFVVTKKQSYNEYKQYIEKIVLKLFENYGLADKVDHMEIRFIDKFRNWK